MKILLIVFITLTISCKRNEKTVEIISNNRSIYDNLFSDIFIDAYDYSEEYTVTIKHPTDYLQPDTIIVVESGYFEIIYWPDYYNKNIGKYVPQMIEIYKTTDKIILGNFIGENIDMLLNSFIEKPIITINEKNIDIKYLNYDYKDRICVWVVVENDIVKTINYGYEM
jgi:hypothetical protein